jgi:sec-independent protein translocase protein TatC
MPVLLVFFNGYQVSSTVENTFALTSYISIFLAMVFVMGLLFEFPSVLAVLSHFGVITRETMKKSRRYAVVIILILSAILTPTGDPFTMLVVAVPLYLLYEFSILICKPGEPEEVDDDLD